MIPADIDPTLCAGEPLLDSLDDGFSPPARRDEPRDGSAVTTQPAEPGPGPHSPF